jgi:hypothetical protein
MLRGIIDNHARRISDHHRCLTLVITMVAMAPGTITNNHIPSAAPRLLTFYSLQMSISILVNNSNTYTLHKYPRQLLTNSHIVLVYFRQPARLPILTFHSHHPTTFVLSHLVWAISVEPHRVRGLTAERNCGILWGRRDHLPLLGG